MARKLPQLPLNVKLAIIDELALEPASLKTFALTTSWGTECHDRIRKHLFQYLTLPPWTSEHRLGEPERTTNALMDVLGGSPQIRNFVRSMDVRDEIHIASDGYLSRALPRIMFGMANLLGISLRAVDLVSILMPDALASCSSLHVVHFMLCRFSLSDVFHLLRAVPNVEELHVLWASVADYEDGHSIDHCTPLDFGVDTIRSRFGIPPADRTGLFLKELAFAGLGLNPLCKGMHGCGSVHLLDFLCTSGVLRGAEKVTVEFNFGDPDGLQRLQALMNMARSEFNLKNVGLLDGLTPNFDRVNPLIDFGTLTRYRFNITLRFGQFFEDSRDLLWRHIVSSLGNTQHQVKELTIDMTFLLPTNLTYPGVKPDEESQLWRWFDLDVALSGSGLGTLCVELHTDLPWPTIDPPCSFENFSAGTIHWVAASLPQTARYFWLTDAEGATGGGTGYIQFQNHVGL
ncbi:hypothetical protein BDZ89DRAFT_1164610 [Hymenopellis radicata]|nr:hypothetical protein BDZ89DRAFT_1164610 [Hymenopellis radicata]